MMLRLALLTALLHYVSAQPETPGRLIIDYGSYWSEILAQTASNAALAQARAENFVDTETNKLETYKAGDWIHHGKTGNQSFLVESNMGLRLNPKVIDTLNHNNGHDPQLYSRTSHISMALMMEGRVEDSHRFARLMNQQRLLMREIYLARTDDNWTAFGNGAGRSLATLLEERDENAIEMAEIRDSLGRMVFTVQYVPNTLDNPEREQGREILDRYQPVLPPTSPPRVYTKTSGPLERYNNRSIIRRAAFFRTYVPIHIINSGENSTALRGRQPSSRHLDATFSNLAFQLAFDYVPIQDSELEGIQDTSITGITSVTPMRSMGEFVAGVRILREMERHRANLIKLHAAAVQEFSSKINMNAPEDRDTLPELRRRVEYAEEQLAKINSAFAQPTKTLANLGSFDIVIFKLSPAATPLSSVPPAINFEANKLEEDLQELREKNAIIARRKAGVARGWPEEEDEDSVNDEDLGEGNLEQEEYGVLDSEEYEDQSNSSDSEQDEDKSDSSDSEGDEDEDADAGAQEDDEIVEGEVDRVHSAVEDDSKRVQYLNRALLVASAAAKQSSSRKGVSDSGIPRDGGEERPIKKQRIE